MSLKYGFVKCKVAGKVGIKGTRRRSETQYHLHTSLAVAGADALWDVAINVGTDDSDDLLRYRIALDFHHAIVDALRGAGDGPTDLTNREALPALDFLPTDLLAETGKWRDSDVMDGGIDKEPYRSLAKLLIEARERGLPVYVFGRFYAEGNGIHDVHMNQGSTGGFVHTADNDTNDHNDVWQDGAVFIDRGEAGWAAYVTAFTQQLVPTDDLGNPLDSAMEIADGDEGSLADTQDGHHPVSPHGAPVIAV